MGLGVGVGVGFAVGVGVGVGIGVGVVAGPVQAATITSTTARLSNRAIILECLTTARLPSREKGSLFFQIVVAHLLFCQMILQ